MDGYDKTKNLINLATIPTASQPIVIGKVKNDFRKSFLPLRTTQSTGLIPLESTSPKFH